MLDYPHRVKYTDVRMQISPQTREGGTLAERFDRLLQVLAGHCERLYGSRLVSLAVFGSVGRRVMRPDSDIDLLVAADPLPRGRMRRVGEFAAVEREMEPFLQTAREAGVCTALSPVFKTPEEVQAGSPLFLDMVDDARILFDRNGFLATELDLLRARLARRGAKRIWQGNAWYWDLKPDYRHGEEFEI